MMNLAIMSTEQQRQPAPQPHLLLVDDDADILILLKQILYREYRITTAHNGQHALRLLEQQPFDLVLLDLMMPDMNGMDVLDSIRLNPQIADLPVVIVSALTHNEDIVRGLQSGANDYITKPFDPDVVRARVHAQLATKKQLDERQQTISNLWMRHELKDRFLKIATHDLKSPLNSIRLAHYHLRNVLGDNPDAIEALDTIETTVNTMNELVEDFLDSAAIQTGKADINLQAVVVEDVIWEVVSRYSATAIQKHITLLIGDTEGVALADYPRLAQIIGNLVSNAIKYSPHNRMVTVASQVNDDFVHITVADEGPGIPEAEHNALFEPFGKLSNRPTGGESSTGLGLWIVRELVSLHNGAAGFECPSEGGSIFWVDIPLFREAEE